jgi:hypothetical protein
MSYDEFWEMMTTVASLGTYISAVGTEGGSANIIGSFEVRSDGRENVFQLTGSKDHVHLDHSRFAKLAFSYFNVGYGDEPLLSLLNTDGGTMMKLYYQGTDPAAKFNILLSNYPDRISGNW